jgi:CheY-like chemotaxis protein
LEKNLPAILGSESELREALSQLISNAIDALPQGGRIKITTGLHRSSLSGSSLIDPQAFLEVRDDGTGMDEVTQQRCFEPFFSTKGPVGSGLGLSTVFGIVRRHGGTIELKSAPGAGTSVRLLFQAIPPVEEENLPTDVPQTTRLRILCIDDDQRISTMLHQVLSAEHHQVEVANGGKRGLDAFRKAQQRGEPFDVVITDLGMPNVDGRQIVRAVKMQSPSTPVILLTGWAAMMDQEGELPEGVDAVLNKPASMDRLQEVLSKVTLAKAGMA